MLTYFFAIGAILFLIFGWIFVQDWARRFAETHPEFGVSREEGGGCGKNCLCAARGGCSKK